MAIMKYYHCGDKSGKLASLSLEINPPLHVILCSLFVDLYSYVKFLCSLVHLCSLLHFLVQIVTSETFSTFGTCLKRLQCLIKFQYGNVLQSLTNLINLWHNSATILNARMKSYWNQLQFGKIILILTCRFVNKL